ncbi:MAG TPA: ABC transporter ATP-binding protein [Gemmatimonadaceae bacterium]|nr:ABC transporter ATP-binding protein [Gemmatimonadaceae bacterium]
MLAKLTMLMSARQRTQLVLLFLGMLAGAMMEMAGIGAIPAFAALVGSPDRVLNNGLVERYFGDLHSVPQSSLLLYAAGALLVLFIFKNTYLFLLLLAQSRFTQRFQSRLAVRVLRAYLYAPYHLHLQRNPSELLRNANSEALEIIASVVMPGMVLTMELLTVAAILTLLFLAEPAVSLFACILLGGTALVFMKTIRSRLSLYGEQIQFFRGKMVQSVHESLSSVKMTKVLGREDHFLKSFAAHTDGYSEANRFRQIATETPRLILEVTAIAGLLGVAAVLTAAGKPPITVTVTLALLSIALVRTIPSVNRITSSVATLRYGHYALEAINKDLTELETQSLTIHGDALPMSFRESIRFDDVSYTYPGASKASLAHISLRIGRGSSVAIIGPTGAGKTTLVDLLLGLLAPSDGCILVDEVNLTRAIASWQRSIGYVPQDIYLTDDSIRGNIALGIPAADIDPAAIDQALSAAQLDEFVRSLPAGLDTVVGERGVRLSGGQRQRIGIARALYHNPSVLIFDEATSSLDTATEELVIQAVDALRGSRTIIVIAHRLSTIRNCDYVFSLRDGAVSSEGPVANFVDRADPIRTFLAAR